MRVIVPHTETGLHDATRDRVRELAPEAEFVELAAGDDEAYWQLLDSLWSAGHDFALIEQDILPHENVFDEFHACGNLWCTFGYPYFVGANYHGSGCVRFRAQLMANVPGLMQAVGEYSNDKHPQKHWCTLDAFIQHELHRRGYQSDRHGPPVGHLDLTVSHGCVE